jgi:hypothetical protein
MTSSDPTIFNCSICHRPIDLKTAKTNEASQLVHEECYVLRQGRGQSVQPSQQSGILSSRATLDH